MEPFDWTPANILEFKEAGILVDPHFRSQLAAFVNDLILHHFDQLVWLLYRIDVSEKKLTTLLASTPKEDAGQLIADMIISRQLEKIKSRQENRRDTNNISEEESW
ncbi:MAG: hypothetical protein JWQ27_1456 [Ferruginibacter sp.]|nr:hypothetical protein [Ferruginibacter sp.]